MRLDPDYPIVTRFLGNWITDTVLEYRSYFLIVIWGGLLAYFLGSAALPLAAGWMIQSFYRAKYYKGPFEFWEQAWKESPRKSRVVTKYAENIMLEIEREMKRGKTFEELQPLIDLGTRLINDTTEGRFNPQMRA